jgi:hypothetical protein
MSSLLFLDSLILSNLKSRYYHYRDGSSFLTPTLVMQTHPFSNCLYCWTSTVTARLGFPICLLSRTGREVLSFVCSMMVRMGGTVSKEDVGGETSGKRSNKRRRDDHADEEVIGALALESVDLGRN